LNLKCVFAFSLRLLSDTFLILRRIEQDMTKMYIGLHVKYSCQILIKLEFSRQISDKYSNITFCKTCLMGSELFHAERWMDGRTDRHETNRLFCNFVKAYEN
jgi:hypothetical protein